MRLGKIILWACMVLILVSSATALGIAPARKMIDFSSGQSQQVSFSILNDEAKDMKVAIYAKGDLANYITMKESLITINSGEASKAFTYTVNFPTDAPNPGNHEVEIIVLELPDEFRALGENAMITGTVAVAQQLRIKVPYPGKYAEARFYADDSGVGDDVKFTIPIFNFGKDTINLAKARIKIYGPTYQEIAEVTTNVISLSPQSEGKLIAFWKADVGPGAYHAEAIIEYDGERVKLEDNFNVGNLFVDIKSIEVGEFNLGGIAKFTIFVENKWNDDIEGLFAEMQITDDSGKEMTKFRTAPTSLGPLDLGSLVSFWETEGVTIGVYRMKVTLFYSGKTTTEEMDIQVNLDSIDTGFAGTGKAISSEGGSSRDTILLIVLVLMVVINIGWFVYFKKRGGKT